MVVIGWIIFEISSPAAEIGFIGSMFGASGIFSDSATINILHNYLLTIIIAAVVATGLPLKLWKKISEKISFSDTLCFVGEAAGMVASIAYLVDATYNPFLYFNF
jgi:alginate O-acetyltransferase complex protein AlgI